MARPATGRRPTVGAPRGVPRTTLGADADGPRLSPRERELVGPLTRHGESRNAAAETLGISVATLKTHVDRIYRKLGIHSRGELFAWAWQRQGRSERPEP